MPPEAAGTNGPASPPHSLPPPGTISTRRQGIRPCSRCVQQQRTRQLVRLVPETHHSSACLPSTRLHPADPERTDVRLTPPCISAFHAPEACPHADDAVPAFLHVPCAFHGSCPGLLHAPGVPCLQETPHKPVDHSARTMRHAPACIAVPKQHNGTFCFTSFKIHVHIK